MRKRSLIGFPCAALALGLALAGCQQPTDGGLGSIPRLASVTVAGVQATLGSPSTDWRGATAGDVLLTAAQASGAEVLASPEDSASTVFVAAARSEGVPPAFAAGGSFEFDGGNFLLVEVFSPNHDLIFYYRINVRIVDPLAAGFTVGGRVATPGSPGAAWDSADIVAGEVVIGSSAAGTALTVAPTPQVASTAFRYAKVAGAAQPVFSSSPSLAAVSDGEFIYIEASSGEDRSTKVVYKIKVTVKSDNTNLVSISVNGVDIGALGAKGANPSSAALPAAYFHVATEAGLVNPAVLATPADAAAVVKYAWSPGNYNQSYIVAPELWSDSISASLSKKSFIYVKVAAPDRSVGYYKFRVTYGNSTLSTAAATLNGSPIALGAPNAAYATAYANRTTLALAADEGLAGSVIAAVLDDPATNATVDFGIGSMGTYGASAPTVWKSGTDVFAAGISSGALMTIRITSEDATLLQYYVILAQR